MPQIEGIDVPAKATQDAMVVNETVRVPGVPGGVEIAFRATDPDGNPIPLNAIEAVKAVVALFSSHGYLLELFKKLMGLVGKRRPDKPDNQTSLLLMWKELDPELRKVVLHYVLDEPIGLTEKRQRFSQEDIYLAMILADAMIAMDIAPDVQATLEIG